MYALVSLHSPNYQPLADLTWNQNKLLYVQKHNYKGFCKSDNFKENTGIGYQKIYYLKELLENNPDIEWFWWTGTDTMITNFAVRMEDRIDNDYHFIICTDVNGINADSFLIRNTPEGMSVLNHIIQLEDECSKHWDVEQRAIALIIGVPIGGDASWKISEEIEARDNYKNIIKIVPQRFMNSFYYPLYHYTDHRDKLGVNGNWNIGDWLLHWPATNLEQRIQLYNHFKNYILN